MFVDGENLTIRGQEFAKDNGITLREGDFYSRDVYLWFPDIVPVELQATTPIGRVQSHAIRAYYYTSVVGDDARIVHVREALWKMGFFPVVFKKMRGREKAKGVDITLTKDLLSHAYQDNYDVAVLISADGDYVPVVHEIQRRGKIVQVDFIPGAAMNSELRLAADTFADITPLFQKWK